QERRADQAMAVADSFARLPALVSVQHRAHEILTMKGAAQDDASDMHEHEHQKSVRQRLVHVLHSTATELVVGRIAGGAGEKAQGDESIDRPTACRIVTHVMLRRAAEERFDVAQHALRTGSQRPESSVARAEESP